MEGAAPESGTGKAAMPQVSYTDLEEKLARAQRERDEALEQQTATAEPPRLAAPQKILDAGAMHRSTQSAILTGE